MKADDICGFEQGIERNVFDTEPLFFFAAAPKKIVIDQARVKSPNAARDLLADVAESYDSDDLTFDFVDIFRAWDPAMPAACCHVLMERDQLAIHGEHQHDRVFTNCDGVGAAV